jgi:hypothetical protein
VLRLGGAKRVESIVGFANHSGESRDPPQAGERHMTSDSSLKTATFVVC